MGAPFIPGGNGQLLRNLRLNLPPDHFRDRRDLLDQLGRMHSDLENDPQIPFGRFNFHFREGQQAPLITPATCGTYCPKTFCCAPNGVRVPTLRMAGPVFNGRLARRTRSRQRETPSALVGTKVRDGLAQKLRSAEKALVGVRALEERAHAEEHRLVRCREAERHRDRVRGEPPLHLEVESVRVGVGRITRAVPHRRRRIGTRLTSGPPDRDASDAGR